MGKFNQLLSSFQIGEVSDRLRGRSDSQQYGQALLTSMNTIHKPQGGVARRPGSLWQFLDVIVPTYDFRKTSYTAWKAIPFNTTDNKKYIVIAVDGPVSEWTYVNLLTGELRPFFPSTAAGTTWTADQINKIQYSQSGDYLGIVSDTKRPLAITWDGTNMTLAQHWEIFSGTTGAELAKRRAFLEIQALNANGQGTLSITGTTMTSSAGIFRSTHVGTYWRLNYGTGTTAVVRFDTYTNATTATITLIEGTISGGTAVGTTSGTSWEEEAWSDYRGYPTGITFFEQRIVYGGTRTHPNRIFESQIGDIDELAYRPTEQDPDYATFTDDNTRAFSFDYSSTENNNIKWLSSGKKLFIGAANREYYASGIQGAMGPLNIDVKAATAFGSEGIQPVRQSTSVVFVQRGGQSIRDLTFSFDEEDYKSQDLTKLSEHLTRRSLGYWPTTAQLASFREVQITAAPFPILWAIDDAGGLFSCTIDKDNSVLAWSHHKLGGKLTISAVDYPPKVMAIVSMPQAGWFNDDGASDRIYLIVKRTMNGTDVITMESIDYGHRGNGWPTPGTSSLDRNLHYIYSDCAVWNITSGLLSNITYPYANTEVAVVGDGLYQGLVTGNGAGVTTLPTQAYGVVVGLPYTHKIETMPITAPSQIGSGKGLINKVHEAVIGLFQSFRVKCYAKVDNVSESTQEFTLSATRTPATQEQRVHMPGFGRDARMVFEDDYPLPFEITYMALEGQNYD